MLMKKKIKQKRNLPYKYMFPKQTTKKVPSNVVAKNSFTIERIETEHFCICIATFVTDGQATHFIGIFDDDNK